jgi:oligopeptide transport system substrate-binding protein
MKQKRLSIWVLALTLITVLGISLTGCQAKEAAQPDLEVAVSSVVNSAGVTLPADAVSLDQQVLHLAGAEGSWLSWDASAYDTSDAFALAVQDSCLKTDKDYNPIPSLCSAWSVSEDGLTWTFTIADGRVWSDGAPITADDLVFSVQRYARVDYDFEWFYSMAGIKNWGAVVSGDLPVEDLGVAKVDDHTFTVTTDAPTPFLPKIFTLLYVSPKHVVQDRLADGSWALDDATRVSSAPYVISSYEKGKEIVMTPNTTYTGPFKAMFEKIIVTFMDSAEMFNAYKNDELDAIGYSYEGVLNPAAMAEVNGNPDLKSQLLTWPNFNTYYLFFDTWNAPFDNLQVRQAFSHAIDRDALVNGPLQFQGQAAYTMNPPGFPGANVDELKTVQNYDPTLAAQLMTEAGYPGGAGFPALTFYLRDASSTSINTAEAIAAMLSTNLGVTIEIQNLDYDLFTEKLWNQKLTQSGDFVFGLVPYEFDFVDGSNLLSVWGGCETAGAAMGDMPGRHTWYNQDFNNLLCEAQSLMGDEARRNDMYKQAERILVEDVALIPIYHGIYNVMIKPYLAGPGLSADSEGVVKFRRFDETMIYRRTLP